MINYNSQTGGLTWKLGDPSMFASDKSFKRWATLFVGKPALISVTDGYYCGEVSSTHLLAHRVCWFLHYGVWPKGMIDHINGKRKDNRIENLRDTDRVGNNRNAKLRADNTSGKSGVTWNSRDKRWNASISICGIRKHIGDFLNKEDAIKAREDVEKGEGYHENHGRSNT